MTMLKTATQRNGITKVSIPGSCGTKVIEVDFEDLKTKESVKVDHIHPDLSAQATYAIQGIENIKNSMLDSVLQLFTIEGADIICNQLDSIHNYLSKEHAMMIGEEQLTASDFNDIVNNVFSLIEVAKILLNLYVDKEHLKGSVKYLEYAQKGVLI